MPVAYLIVAHNQPSHLVRLVKALEAPDSTFFVHIDRNVDEGAFRAALVAMTCVKFVEKRVRVRWGAFSQVRATLCLLDAALTFDTPFHRFCLLSGTDFPIQSNARIHEALSSNLEFIRVDRRVGASEPHSHKQNVAKFWFLDAPPLLRTSLSGRFRRRPYGEIALYHGSNWWSLTRECVEYVMDFVDSNPAYARFMRYTLCSDEMFFHSIVKASPFAKNITEDFERAGDAAAYRRSNKHGAHYIDWNAKDAKLPKVLGIEDFDALLASSALFARKFDAHYSMALIEQLESTRAH